MKKSLLLFVALVLLAGGALMFTGCVGAPMAQHQQMLGLSFSNEGRFSQLTTIPVKDFEVVGLVFYETNFRATGGNITGDVFTFHGLLREAERRGAHAIINVTIDKLEHHSSVGGNRIRNETWWGTALAIRYTNNIRPGEAVLQSP